MDSNQNVQGHQKLIVIKYIYIYIYIYIHYCWISPNTSHLYDHGFMDVIPIVRQSKNWLYTQTSDTFLLSWRQPFCNYKMAASMKEGMYHLFVHKVNFLTAWRLVLHLWNHGRTNDLSLDLFNNNSNHPHMCMWSTLCGKVDKHSPFDTYMYVYMCPPNVIITVKWKLFQQQQTILMNMNLPDS